MSEFLRDVGPRGHVLTATLISDGVARVDAEMDGMRWAVAIVREDGYRPVRHIEERPDLRVPGTHEFSMRALRLLLPASVMLT